MIRSIFFCKIFIISSLSFIFAQNNLTVNVFEKFTSKKYLNQVVDVRSVEFYNIGRIKNSINIDSELPNFEDRFTTRFRHADSVFLYCQNGKKSNDVLIRLKDMGYKNVFFLEGGFEAWTRASKPYQSSNNTKKPLAFYSEKDLENYTKNYKYVMIDFYADWCGPCKKMAPILQKIADENPEIKLLKINADYNQTLVSAKDIEEIPTLLIYKYGQQKWRKTGIVSKENLEKLFQ